MHRNGVGTARIELNRPRGAERVEQAARRRPARRPPRVGAASEERCAPCASPARGAPSPPGRTCGTSAAMTSTPEGRPNVYGVLTERYHPIMHAIREMDKPVVAAVNGGRSGSAARWRCAATGGGGRQRLLPARLRKHRTGARRRLLAVRTRCGSEWRGRPRWRCWASAWAPPKRSNGVSSNARAPRMSLERESAALTARWRRGPTRSYAATKRLAQRALYSGMDEQLELEATLQQEMARQRRLPRGRERLPRRAPGELRGTLKRPPTTPIASLARSGPASGWLGTRVPAAPE